jgi:signal transduction histidine kinase
MDVIGAGTDFTKDPKFVSAKAGKTWYSPVYFRKETEPYMTISRPAGGVGGGITIAEVNLKFVWEVVSRIQIGKAGLAYVVNSEGTLIAHPDISLVLQKTDLSKLAQVAALTRGEGVEIPIARNLKGEQVLTAHAGIPTLNWTVFVELPFAEAFAPLYASILRIGLLLLAGLVLAVLASVYLARVMVTPIRALQQGAARIGTGQLDQRIEVHTGDELEALSEQFNKMAADLKAFYAGLERKVEERTAELKEALEQQTATTEILRVISSSPTDIRPVLDAVAESAARFCGADDVVIRRVDGEALRATAHFGPMPMLEETVAITPRTVGGRATLERRTIHIHDILDGHVKVEFPDAPSLRRQAVPFRTLLVAPLLREDTAIGNITMRRPDVRPFSDKQIKLLETFAAQAVIAIENVRLFNETKEALEQQTTTAEILKVISSSPTDVQPVFDAIVNSGVALFGGMDLTLRLVKGDYSAIVASTRLIQGIGDLLPLPLGDDATPGSRAITRREVVQIPDMLAAEWVTADFEQRAERRGFRAIMCVPMLRENTAIGAMSVTRASPGLFTDKEVALLQTFASQAVIAIENVRLFKELQARNVEVSESLEQQTATAEILRVISSSPTDVQPVFDAIAESADRLCESSDIIIRRVDGVTMRLVAHIGSMPVTEDPGFDITAKTIMGRAARERRSIHIHDVLVPQVRNEYPDSLFMFQTAGGYRTVLVVPLLREDTVIGVIIIRRAEVRPFSDKQIKLLETFAAQAVIAIENVRLFTELESRNKDLGETLEQQTATAEILKVISSSPTDVQPVFDAIVKSGVRLFGGLTVAIRLVRGDRIQEVATSQPYGEDRDVFSVPINDDQFLSPRAIVHRRIVHVPDIRTEDWTNERMKRRAEQRGWRAILCAPMLKENISIGTIVVTRAAPGPFTEKQIALLRTFADQAVIAIENVRLFREINEALERQTATSEVLKVISRSTFDLEPVLESLVENARKLCDADRATISRADKDGNYAPVIERALEPNPEYLAYAQLHPLKPDRGSAVGRAVLDRRPVHIPDIHADPEYSRLDLANVRSYRTVLAVPMLREGEPIGVFVLTRDKEPNPFTEKQVEVVTSFADQAVIAIENVRLFNEIQDKSRQLEIANKHKSEFLANMSHELRTPLNAIIGFSEALIEKMFGEMNAKQEDYLKDIHSSGRHLLSLINDILDLSKIEAGRMELEVSEFHLPTALQNAMTLVRERAQTHGIALKSRVDPKLAEIRADERKFKQILLNLLSNAVKFTPDGGRVEVDARRNGTTVEVSVKDNGVGIAKADQEAVFEEFRQVGRDYTTKQEGTGLGLTLTRRFVELHGGKIWLKSAPGKGSTFTFSLPLDR